MAKETKEKTTVATETEPVAAEKAKSADYWHERVPLMVPVDPTNPRDDELSIILNGKIYQIKRGVTVMVPRCVRQVYDDSQAQMMKAYSRAADAARNA